MLISSILTLGAGSALPGLLMAAAVLLMTFSVMSIVRKRLARRPRPGRRVPRPARQQPPPRPGHESARRRIEELMVDAEELVRRLAAHLDNKAARIELLLKEADARLEQLAGQAGPRGGSQIEPSRSSVSDRAEPRQGDPVSQDVYSLSDEGLAPIEIASKLSEGVGKVELILALRDN